MRWAEWSPYPCPDHRNAIHRAHMNKLVEIAILRDSGRTRDFKWPKERLTRRGSWRALTAVWHGLEWDARIKGVEPRTKSLCDVLHGLGACFMGEIVVLGVAFFALGFPVDSRGLLTEPVGWVAVVLSVAFYLSMWRTLHDFLSVTNGTILHALSVQEKRRRERVPVLVAERDTEGCIQRCLNEWLRKRLGNFRRKWLDLY